MSNDDEGMVGGGACHAPRCGCALLGRRQFTRLLAIGGASLALVPAWAREGVELPDRSSLASLVPAERVEAAASDQYRQMIQQAAQQRALVSPSDPAVRRLRTIAARLVPFAESPNLKSTPRAANWRWEVNLIASPQINAFCMPGGKIAFYTGLLQKLQLTDDEVAIVMGHEIAHALREHARERLGKSTATNLGIELGAALLGLGNGGRYVAGLGGQLLKLQFSRTDESEADMVGLDLAARAGYDPRAGVTLWRKMGAASRGAPPQWLSTHPAGETRIRDIERTLPEVMPLYERAAKPRSGAADGSPAR